MKKPSFNQSQMGAACAILHTYGVQHGSTGTDIHQRTAALGVLAVMLGMVDAVPGPYKHLIGDVVVSADPEENESLTADIPSQEEYLTAIENAASARVAEIFDGTVRDEDGSLFISKPFADMLKVDEGKWVTFTTAVGMVERVMADAADPDTIIGKQVLETIAANATEPEAKADLESMTVAELTKLAEDNNVPLGSATKKADIIAVLREFNF